MNTGDIIEARIIDTNANGAGIAKIDGAAVFIGGSVEGDLVKAEIISHEKNYYTAKLIEIIEESEYRITPECANFSLCGGCTLGNINFEYENKIKKQTVVSAFRRAGLDYAIVGDTLHTDERKHYRNNITLHYNGGKFGYYAEKTNVAVDFGKCLLSSVSFYAVADYVNAHVSDIGMFAPSDMHIRDNSAGDITVSIYTGKKVPESKKDEFRGRFFQNFSEESTKYTVNFVCGNTGASVIDDRIFGLDMRFSSEAFRQVNTSAFEKLLEVVCSMAEDCKFTFCADLYCGSGIIGLAIAKSIPNKRFIGIEINPDSIRDAKVNAKINGIENIEFFAGDSADLKKHLNNGVLPELITVDPPRAGLSKKMCADIVSVNPDNIIYVSCNPQTLVRDLKYFADNGYSIEKAIPVNLFPYTKHVETVCLLVLRNPVTHINIDVDVEEMVQDKRGMATYGQIKDYVLEHSGLNVSSLYIAQVKQKHGIIERENYNKPKSEDARQPQCPPEKERAITEALKHFGML